MREFLYLSPMGESVIGQLESRHSSPYGNQGTVGFLILALDPNCASYSQTPAEFTVKIRPDLPTTQMVRLGHLSVLDRLRR